MVIPQDLRQFDSLVQIIALLRGPNGCKWDCKQTHRSLRENLLEESYEVLEALDEDNCNKLCSELGDLLLQIVLHAQISQEAKEFDMDDVIEAINRKLIFRHPHVFGTSKAKDEEEVLVLWEELKKQERNKEAGMLDGVPKNLPALSYSQAVQARVARVGFDWPNDTGVLSKLTEEIVEFGVASTPQEKTEEMGDILFTLANYARHHGIDLEASLREANHKFYKRFSSMEKMCRENNMELSKLSFDKQNELWEQIKKTEINV